MKIKDLLLKLKEEGIDTSHFAEYYEEYYKKYSDKPQEYKFNENLWIFTHLKSLMMALKYFRPYFEEEEYSKLVCKKIISFSRIHCAFMSGNPSDPDVYVGSLATPRTDLPAGLSVSCSKQGLVKVSTLIGYPPRLVENSPF